MPTLSDKVRRLNLDGNPRAHGPKKLPPLILMTDSERLADPLPAATALPRGSAVILRHYGDSCREELARSLSLVCRRRGLLLLVAGDAHLALRVGAAGLHLPEGLSRRGFGFWRGWHRPDWIVTAAAHSPAALWRAFHNGADAALLSPVFETSSHPHARTLGPLLFATWSRLSPLPVYALGGVSATNADRLMCPGLAGFAAISALD